ncbi:hypothetical protein [Streptomyces bluensis]|uniref:hypothetical protein n=1 Tax=Streptomyces bluensis TaxID=33897 RepID=UPI00331D9080
MAVMTDVLVPALEDACEAHASIADRFRSDATLTPPGVHRQQLESQTADTEQNLERIEHRVRQIRPGGLVDNTRRIVRDVTGRALRVSVLPVEVGMTIVAGLLRGQAPGDERQLLRKAQDEYTAAARALAACRAGQSIAEQLDDRETADLLALMRHQNQELLDALEDRVGQRAREVAAVAAGQRPARLQARGRDGGLLIALPRAVRTALEPFRAALRTSTRRMAATAEGAWWEMPDTTAAANEVQGMGTRERDLPIPGFSQLGVTEIQQSLRGLSQRELTVVEGYERAHAGRRGVLNAIERLREPEPWPGYDAMGPDHIKLHLRDVPDDVARQAQEYERRHQQRQTVINAVEERAPM